ncbi:MAG: hypothetical protein ACREQO_23840, partial [Candidatus Binatia bacterium]
MPICIAFHTGLIVRFNFSLIAISHLDQMLRRFAKIFGRSAHEERFAIISSSRIFFSQKFFASRPLQIGVNCTKTAVRIFPLRCRANPAATNRSRDSYRNKSAKNQLKEPLVSG